MVFDFNEEWSQVTNTVIGPDGDVRSVTQPHWAPVPIEWVSLDAGPGQLLSMENAAIYDNLGLPDIPVTIVAQPRSQTVRSGWNVTLASAVDGTLPRFIQWFREGESVPGGTSASLLLSAVGPAQAGQYHFVLSNEVSTVTSGPAVLVVTNPPLPEAGSVVAWGDASMGQTQVPAGLQAVAVAGGHYHGLALKPDGTVVAWGDNTYGQTTPLPGLRDVLAIAACNNHNLAIMRGEIVPPPAPQLTLESWQDGAVGLRIVSEPGWPCRIDVSSDLTSWTPLETRTPSESPWVLLDHDTGASLRFYRALNP